jgi:SPP1 gp7 family putative phage head morphogenesis protein
MSSYWEKRFLRDKAASVNSSERWLANHQKRYFAAAQREITDEIEKIYQSFADREKITLAEARTRIGNADFGRVDFGKMAAEQVKRNRELRRQKESLPGDVVAIMEKQNQAYEKQLAELARKGQITRLSMLQANIDKALLDLYDKNQISIYDHLAGQYESAYYKSMFNCQQALGFGKDFTALNRRAIDTAVLGSYKKSNYSKRLYAHCRHFSKDLKDNLITGLIRGENMERMAARIRARLNVAAGAARRLVRTETAYIYEKAAAAAYQECGIEQYEYLATLDHKTSSACQELDGKVFSVQDAVPGKNYPPMHPNCRSTTVCHFDDDKVTVRTATGRGGKTYDVPSDMTYRQWEKTVSGIGKNAEFTIHAHEDGKNITSERIAVYQAVGAVPPRVREALESTRCIVGKYSACRYDYENDIMYIAKGAGKRDVIHEIGHVVDNKLADREKVEALRKKMLQDTLRADIVKDTFYDTQGNPVTILRVQNEFLISEYQGRIYADSIEDAFGEAGQFDGGLLYEFVSEPFREYMEAPDELKRKSPELYELIREAVE